jgi:NAD-dependent deacetylase
LLRPDVVWFGEPLPAAVLEAALRAAERAEVFLVVGTSAVVQPAASLPLLARRAGARVVEVNTEATPLSSEADASLLGPAGVVLPQLLEAAVRQ